MVESGDGSSAGEERRRRSSVTDLSSLFGAVKARKAEFIRQRSIRVKVGTWNVAAISGTERDVGKWFVEGEGISRRLSGLKDISGRRATIIPGGGEGEREEEGRGRQQDSVQSEGSSDRRPQIDLYVLGLQEIVDVSSPAEALRPYVDPAPSGRWKAAVQEALPLGYQLVAEAQLVGLLLLIYAAPSVVPDITSVSSTSVGTGLLGYMGNKGATATRMVLGETTGLIFINSHLAAGSDKTSLERRNWDAGQIVSRTKFERISPERDLMETACDLIGDEDFGFWFGDLNYRLEDIPGDDVRRVLARHAENEYDRTCEPVPKTDDQEETADTPHAVVQKKQKENGRLSSSDLDGIPDPVSDHEIEPHNDPASLQTTISSLLPHDQLRIQQKHGKAFHEGWREGEIRFLPTYKYDVGSVAIFDSSEKHRGPSWCDRILYRTHQDRLDYERRMRESAEANKRDEEMKARGLDKAAADDNVLFEYDPATDGADSISDYDPSADGDGMGDQEDSGSQTAPANESIRLEYYVSHQGILSSDHKPINAEFTLTFDAVVPDLKAKVHEEVVRELDKAENEARPALTLVIDVPSHEVKAAREGGRKRRGSLDEIDLGDVPFAVPITRSMTVANTGSVPATFSFAERPTTDSALSSPSWLTTRVERAHGDDSPGKHEKHGGPADEHTLLPGEVANVEVTACIRDMNHVRLLNSGRLKLEEILVLRVTRGRDHFIPLHGQWLPTCFGRSLDELTRIPEAGARSLVATITAATTDGKDPLSGEEGPEASRLSAPRELFRLTEAISEMTERAVAEWDMIKGGGGSAADIDEVPPWMMEPYGTGWPFKPETWTLRNENERAPLLAAVRNALDTNKSVTAVFPPEVPSLHRLEILCETLEAFLPSLSDGVVTASVWQEMDRQIIDREKSKTPPRSWEESQAWVLENLAYSPAHSVSFTFVTFMLARIANEIAPVAPAALRSSSSYNATTTHQPSSSLSSTPTTTTTSSSSSSSDRRVSFPTPASTAAFIVGGSFRRKSQAVQSSSSSSSADSSTSTPNENPVMLRRQAIELAFGSLFAGMLISSDVPVPSKEKDRRALDERKRSIIEPFLKTVGVDSQGPSGGN
ncbi:hypothetical protein ASPZODRAFT_150531 [Penicilliopsis zonata CBS 506.65]|uniref:Inositol polyphosphate-related phosphatase domain-containing protein n=1 Tax=Penicilliopsis zonata CBS 506.65 TaxID=1073090 RepID=A0A1L9SLZ0_9EURO|nr:hypothetical protein ASPZODRAFT_150531 [Penicilliopsis zonata CBS 506.65]OJJ48259.1 hypothetical protein ASPZODRAFT_150531 [Penicilliopsis zonata CBS 506.65]